ncbi:MAG TPA: cupin domain-containing protein [Stellaceae bacterium]|nr:cupin domain-containing protein [Stellaceae bacterium]
MDRTIFEAELQAEGYRETALREMPANQANPEHDHPFDARLLILGGEMTIACGGEERTYRAGDTFTMAAGRRHAERAGPAGVQYLAGRRHPAA